MKRMQQHHGIHAARYRDEDLLAGGQQMPLIHGIFDVL